MIGKRLGLLPLLKILHAKCGLWSLSRYIQASTRHLAATEENTRPASDTHLVKDSMSPPKPFLVSGSCAAFVGSLSDMRIVPFELSPSPSGGAIVCSTDARLLLASKNEDPRLSIHFNGGIQWVGRCRPPKHLVCPVQFIITLTNKDSAQSVSNHECTRTEMRSRSGPTSFLSESKNIAHCDVLCILWAYLGKIYAKART